MIAKLMRFYELTYCGQESTQRRTVSNMREAYAYSWY